MSYLPTGSHVLSCVALPSTLCQALLDFSVQVFMRYLDQSLQPGEARVLQAPLPLVHLRIQ